MTITIRKLHLAIAVLAIALIAPATAFAGSIFDDVDDNRFYAAPIEWALDNDITTGSPAGSDTFKPDDPVTRGENITFAKRYDDNIVQPALDALTSNVATHGTDIATNTSAIAANAAGIAAGAGVNFADSEQFLPLTLTPQSVRSVELVAPAAGHVIVTASGSIHFGSTDLDSATCSITDGAIAVDGAHGIFASDSGVEPSFQSLPFAGTRTFAVPAGSTTFHLVCREVGTVFFEDSQLTALYVPNLYAP